MIILIKEWEEITHLHVFSTLPVMILILVSLLTISSLLTLAVGSFSFPWVVSFNRKFNFLYIKLITYRAAFSTH